jgi:hypothetical protein
MYSTLVCCRTIDPVPAFYFWGLRIFYLKIKHCSIVSGLSLSYAATQRLKIPCIQYFNLRIPILFLKWWGQSFLTVSFFQLEVVGRGGLIQARVLKLKKAVKGDANAREVSDALPFLGIAINQLYKGCSNCKICGSSRGKR